MVRVAFAIPLVFCLASGCRSDAPEQSPVRASYDKATGKLTQLTVSAGRDGEPDIVSYMDGPKIVRIEIDKNEDGKIDRWEYYNNSQKLEKVGLSRVEDGIADTWIIQSPDGTVEKIEVSTRRDGKPNRFEFYEKGVLSRTEQDTDGDGRIDKWESYKDGALVTVSFDTSGRGSPDKTIHYPEAKTDAAR
jgi:antitoxin component YwqK of YwqJK toxin-antitoxin module